LFPEALAGYTTNHKTGLVPWQAVASQEELA
jgi:hypothetical protein